MATNEEQSTTREAADKSATDRLEAWEAFFEDPENGLIAMIGQAHSLEILDLSARTAIANLLSHEDEQDRRRQYEQQLADALGTDDGEADLEHAKDAVITLLRCLKDEGAPHIDETDRAASDGTTPADDDAARNRRRSLRGAPREQPQPARSGRYFAQVNKIGAIVISTVVLLAIGAVAIYFREPVMPEADRKAVTDLLRSHGEAARPAASWEVVNSGLSGDRAFELIYRVTDPQHLAVFRSLSPMKRTKLAADLCPRGGELTEKTAAYATKIRIEIKGDGETITSTSCP